MIKFFNKRNFDCILIVSYLLVGFIPYFRAIDKIAPQFFYLSILNSISFIYLILSHKKIYFKYGSFIIFSLLGFLIWSGLSYFYALNKAEVIIETSRVLTYLVSLIFFYLTLNRNKDLIKLIPYLITLILFIEITYVFERFFERYSFGQKYSRDMGLRAFTGNINITAFNFLLKLPFLIYVLDRTKIHFLFKVILLSLFVFCLFLMGSRGANILILGLIFTICFLHFLFKGYYILSKKTVVIIFIGLLVGGLSNYKIFSEDKDINIVQRTSNLNNESTQQRLRFYSAAISSIIENPILGIGIGNWKIHATKYDKPYMQDYTVPYHAHNDYLEIFAELGIVGFILFFGSIVWLLFLIIKAVSEDHFFETESNDILIFVFLSILVYLGDSFLNFPFTRPVIQIQNLFYWATALIIIEKSFYSKKSSLVEFEFNLTNKIFAFILFSIVFSFQISVSKRVYDSFVEQQFLTAAGNGSFKDYTKEYVYSINSKLPSITATTIPIETLKANLIYNLDEIEDTLHYMIDEGQKQNPYIPYNQLTKSVLYIKERKPDSAYVYAKEAFYDLPNSIIHFNLLMDIAEVYSDSLEIEKAINYFKGDLRNEFYEKYLITAYNVKNKMGSNELSFLEKYNSKNPSSDVAKAFNAINQVGLKNVEDGYLKSIEAEKYFDDENYKEAALSFISASNLNPMEISYRENAANSLMKIGNDDQAIEILKKLLIDLNPSTGKAEYLLGIIYLGEKDYLKGCDFLNKSQKKGFVFPEIISERFCVSKDSDKK